MKKLIQVLSIAILFAVSFNAKGQSATISKKNFDNGADPPDSMTVGFGNSDWAVDNGSSGIPPSTGYTGASANYYLLADDGDGAGDVETITYTVSTMAYSNIRLKWGAYTSNDIFGPGSGSFPTMTLSYSTDGTNFTSVIYTENAVNNTWKLDSVTTLPVGASNAAVLYLRWSYVSDGATYLYAFDDIWLTGTINTYFSNSSGNLDVLSTWGTNFDGTGTSPANFTTNAIYYEIVNNASATIGSAWTVSGTGSKVIVGDAATTPTINFTIPSATAFTGTVDVQNKGTLTIQNATTPTFTLGKLATGSTVNYAVLGSQSILKGTYSNLTISGSGTKTLPVGSVTVNGIFNISAGIAALANSTFATLNIMGSVTGAGTISGNTNAKVNILGSGALGTIVFTTGAQTVSAFKVNRSGTFTLTLGSDLTVTKAFEHDNSGVFDLNGHSLTIGGTALQLSTTGNATFSGSSTSNLSTNGIVAGSLYMAQTSLATSSLSSLIVNSSLTLGNSLNIIDSVMPRSGTLTTGGHLILIADQTTVGHVGRIGAVSGTISGNVTSQVYHKPNTNNTDWRLLGVAGVSTASFSQWNAVSTGGSGTIPMTCPTCPYTATGSVAFSSITKYDEPTGNYPDITYGSNIAPGTGYWVYLGTSSPSTASSPILISVSGSPVTGNQSVGLTAAGASTLQGYNLVANPYASSISFAKLRTDNPTIDDGWYTYSPEFGDNAAYVGSISTPSYSHGGTGVDDIIPAGMGFFVHTNSATTLTFKEFQKKTSSNETLLRGANPNSVQSSISYFRLQASGHGMTNETVLRFDPTATAAFNGDFDLYDFPSANVGWLQISTMSNNDAYTIKAFPDFSQNLSIPIKITTGTTGQYQITATDWNNVPAGACIKLHDNYTNQDYDIKGGSFNLNISDTEKVARFVLNITVNQLALTTNLKQASCHTAANGLITAVGNSTGPWNYIWKDAIADTIVKTSLNKTTADTLTGLNNGVYSVEVNTAGSCDAALQSFTVTAPGAATSLFTAPLTANAGSTITFTNSSTDATTYTWNFGDGNTASQAAPTYVYNNAGTYTITLVANNVACNETSTSTQVITVDAATGIKQAVAGSGDIFVSKDATGNYLQFNYAAQTKVNITVYNVLGQVMLNNAGLSVVTDKIYLNVADSKNQVLYVTITDLTTNIQTTKKFLNN